MHQMQKITKMIEKVSEECKKEFEYIMLLRLFCDADSLFSSTGAWPKDKTGLFAVWVMINTAEAECYTHAPKSVTIRAFKCKQF